MEKLKKNKLTSEKDYRITNILVDGGNSMYLKPIDFQILTLSIIILESP